MRLACRVAIAFITFLAGVGSQVIVMRLAILIVPDEEFVKATTSDDDEWSDTVFLAYRFSLVVCMDRDRNVYLGKERGGHPEDTVMLTARFRNQFLNCDAKLDKEQLHDLELLISRFFVSPAAVTADAPVESIANFSFLTSAM